MKTTIPSNLIHVVILDISGVYAQIHNDGYFEQIEVEEIKQTYSDDKRWKVVEI